MTKICIHCIVEGKVQGVWFRSGCKKRADQLKITGWVRNTEEGTVELVACGAKEKLEVLRQWLHKGPPLARVTGVRCNILPMEEHEDFAIL